MISSQLSGIVDTDQLLLSSPSSQARFDIQRLNSLRELTGPRLGVAYTSQELDIYLDRCLIGLTPLKSAS